MRLDIAEQDLKQGVLGLVVALVEIIRDTLRLQAMKRVEAGGLTEQEVERLGEALLELDAALEKTKQEMGVAEAVKSVRASLDQALEDFVAALPDPGRWDTAQEKVSHGAELRI